VNFQNQYRPSGFGHLPVVTKNIVIINVLMFVFKMILLQQGINLDDYFGLHDHLSPNFKPHQFITYIFMHGDLSHIFFNMLGVYIFGQVLEQIWGPKRYLIFYLLTGLGAALVQYVIMHYQIMESLTAINSELDTNFLLTVRERSYLIDQKDTLLRNAVVVGASGSLMGLLGGFGMLFPNRYIYIYFLFPIKAKWLVILYGAFEIFSGIQNDPNDPVAHFAHIGGLLVGVLLVLLWRKDRQHFY
jgi:membrane associated rhomboid family serine protease